MEKKIVRYLFLALSLFFLFPGIEANADGNRKPGSIEVLICDEKEAIEGISVYLHKVASVDEETVQFTNLFKQSEISIQELINGNKPENAQVLLKYVQRKEIQGDERRTTEDGIVTYEHLEEGIYLVHGNEGERVSYLPFLIFVPTDIDGIPQYDVLAEPKIMDEPDPEPPAEEKTKEEEPEEGPSETMIPQTGVNMIPVYLLIITGGILVVWGIADLLHKRMIDGMEAETGEDDCDGDDCDEDADEEGEEDE